MFLQSAKARNVWRRLPRASGGVSRCGFRISAAKKSSPRKRGCFFRDLVRRAPFLVFPAQAGVFLITKNNGMIVWGLPRASGGVSIRHCYSSSALRSSPRKRGCFSRLPALSVCVSVFPAQAGVFPVQIVKQRHRFWSSPRKRGCFSRLEALGLPH